MTVATLMVQPKIQFLDNSGEPLSGGLVYTYQAGTLIQKTSYQSATMQAVNTNPVVLDSSGRANIWLDTSSTYYQIKVTDSLGNLIEMVDNVTGVGQNLTTVVSPAFPWVDVSSYTNLATAVTAIGSSKATLVISNTQVTDSVTIPSNVDLKILQTGNLSVNSGKTVTVNGSFESGLYQVFSGTGNIVFGTNTVNRVQPEWWGALNNNSNNDQPALVAAIASLTGGGVVELAAGTGYLCTAPFTIPAYTTIRGQGMNVSYIKRGFTGDFITSLGAFSGLEYLTIDGQTTTWGSGRGVLIPTGSPQQFVNNAAIQNFSTSCLEFAMDGGSGFSSINGVFYTTGTAGSVAAVYVNGTDDQAIPRAFVNATSNGCTLFNFGGCNNFYASGFYTNGLIFSSASTKVMISDMRIGAAGGTVTVAGADHVISGISASNFTLTCTGSYINVQCPDNSITDNGTGNVVTIRLVSFTPTWTSSGTAPSFGNATVVCNWARVGAKVSVVYDITFGSTTTFGTGYWMFSLPVPDVATPINVSGSGFTQGTVAGTDILFIPRTQGTGILRLYSVVSGTLATVGGTSRTWVSGDVIRFSLDYYTP